MRAIVVDRWMEPEELKVREAPAPEPGPGALQIEVKAAGCNFFDILMCRGKYQVKPPFPFVPGAEFAGVVRGVGAGVSGFAEGDRVLASGSGGFAERAVAPAGNTRALPGGMDFAEAAALPVIYPTAWAALVLRAGLRQGETLLVHAAAGGVGTAAVQIGRALGARVLATAGGAEKLEVAARAGAEQCFDYREEDFAARVLEATEGRGADVIYDPVGGEVFDRSLKCIAWNGRLLVIGFAGGQIPSVKANRILLKNIAVVGLHWGAYNQHEPERVSEAFEALFDLHQRGAISPLIYGRYPLEQTGQALCELGSRKTWGKLIIEP
ncbi:MAG: NADPH:quinone oxidoreductase family protein [Deltaproteobacteria bacterium]|nr:NADPH:quinone oxidoreductase family protein [Deltaproteobacteria bacterium]